MSITGREQTAVPAAGNGAPGTAAPIRGRFKLTPVEPTGAILGWTDQLCDRCLDCGCGRERPAIDLTPQRAMKTFLMLQGWMKNGIPK